MDSDELEQIAQFLLGCREVVAEENAGALLPLYLNRLEEVIRRVRGRSPSRSVWGLRYTLAVVLKQARRLRWEIEGRLGVRN